MTFHESLKHFWCKNEETTNYAMLLSSNSAVIMLLSRFMRIILSSLQCTTWKTYAITHNSPLLEVCSHDDDLTLVLPDHSPKVLYRVLHRSLSGNVLSGVVAVTLWVCKCACG